MNMHDLELIAEQAANAYHDALPGDSQPWSALGEQHRQAWREAVEEVIDAAQTNPPADKLPPLPLR